LHEESLAAGHSRLGHRRLRFLRTERAMIHLRIPLLPPDSIGSTIRRSPPRSGASSLPPSGTSLSRVNGQARRPGTLFTGSDPTPTGTKFLWFMSRAMTAANRSLRRVCTTRYSWSATVPG
jgi:hypothetical protein